MRKVHRAASLSFMQHSPHHSHLHEHEHEHGPDDSAVGDMLELDAAVMGAYLDTAIPGDDPLDVHIVAAMDIHRWNSFPDWTGAIEKAGLDVVDRVDLTLEVDMLSDNVFRYGEAWFSRVRLGLAAELSEDDRATLDALASAEPQIITEYTDDRSEILP